MTRIVIDGVETLQDLYEALAKVVHVFRNPTKFGSDEERFYKHGSRPEPAPPARPAAAVVPAPRAVTPYVPCPRRGSHLRLADCWVCFSDVHRGACLEVDAVAPEGWDVAMARLASVPDYPPAAAETNDDGEWLMLPFAPASPDEGGEAA